MITTIASNPVTASSAVASASDFDAATNQIANAVQIVGHGLANVLPATQTAAVVVDPPPALRDMALGLAVNALPLMGGWMAGARGAIQAALPEAVRLGLSEASSAEARLTSVLRPHESRLTRPASVVDINAYRTEPPAALNFELRHVAVGDAEALHVGGAPALQALEPDARAPAFSWHAPQESLVPTLQTQRSSGPTDKSVVRGKALTRRSKAAATRDRQPFVYAGTPVVKRVAKDSALLRLAPADHWTRGLETSLVPDAHELMAAVCSKPNQPVGLSQLSSNPIHGWHLTMDRVNQALTYHRPLADPPLQFITKEGYEPAIMLSSSALAALATPAKPVEHAGLRITAQGDIQFRGRMLPLNYDSKRALWQMMLSPDKDVAIELRLLSFRWKHDPTMAGIDLVKEGAARVADPINSQLSPYRIPDTPAVTWSYSQDGKSEIKFKLSTDVLNQLGRAERHALEPRPRLGPKKPPQPFFKGSKQPDTRPAPPPRPDVRMGSMAGYYATREVWFGRERLELIGDDFDYLLPALANPGEIQYVADVAARFSNATPYKVRSSIDKIRRQLDALLQGESRLQMDDSGTAYWIVPETAQPLVYRDFSLGFGRAGVHLPSGEIVNRELRIKHRPVELQTARHYRLFEEVLLAAAHTDAKGIAARSKLIAAAGLDASGDPAGLDAQLADEFKQMAQAMGMPGLFVHEAGGYRLDLRKLDGWLPTQPVVRAMKNVYYAHSKLQEAIAGGLDIAHAQNTFNTTLALSRDSLRTFSDTLPQISSEAVHASRRQGVEYEARSKLEAALPGLLEKIERRMTHATAQGHRPLPLLSDVYAELAVGLGELHAQAPLNHLGLDKLQQIERLCVLVDTATQVMSLLHPSEQSPILIDTAEQLTTLKPRLQMLRDSLRLIYDESSV